MSLINCKVHIELNWIEDYIISSAEHSAKFNMMDAELHVPIITLCTRYNVNFTKQLSHRFKTSVYWSNYQTIPIKVIYNGTNIHRLLSASL